MRATQERVAPADANECAAILARANAEERTVSIGGALTKRYIGDDAQIDLELRTTSIAGIVDHVPADLTVTVAAGTRVFDLREALARAGQFLPIDTPHAEDATIGGVIAANANGFWRARYGGVRDLLIGTRVALTDGTVVRSGGRVVKNVAGYDLNKLFVGSFGTLGVVVEATFKVLPIPVAEAGLVARFGTAGEAFKASEIVARAPARAEAVVVERQPDGWELIVSARGDDKSVARAMADARRAAGTAETGAVAERLGSARELPARAASGALIRAALPLAAQTDFADAAARLGTFAALVADAASAIHRVHLVGEDDAVAADAAALVASARAAGGTCRIERRSEGLRGRLRTWPHAPLGDTLMRRLKGQFDPAGILEPGRSPVRA